MFSQRLAARYEELKSLYCGLYHNDSPAFDYFCGMLERSFNSRKASLHALDAVPYIWKELGTSCRNLP